MVIRNFLFHRVTDEYDELWPALTPRKFERILSYLQKHFSIISLEEYLKKEEQTSYNKPPVSISFDDGFKDNSEIAAEILYKKGIPASFYVVTDCISHNVPTWTYRLDYLMRETKVADFKLQGLLTDQYSEVLHFDNRSARLDFVRWLKPYLKVQPLAFREKILEQLYTQTNDVKPPSVMMNWDDVRGLQKKGFTVGSHSVSHPMLGQITDTGKLYSELKESALAIERHTGYFPETISYPNGNYNDTVMEQAKQAGYKYGLAVHQRFYDTGRENIYAIPRIELYQEPWLKIQLRISGVWETMRSFLKK